MELDLTPDQSLLLETTQRFLDDHADAGVLRDLRNDERGFDPEYWRRGCDLGWTSLLVAEDDGGGSVSGSGLLDLVLVAFEFGRHAAPGPLITTNVVAAVLSRFGTPEQKQDLLEGILAGTTIATWAHAEPRPNDRLGAVATKARSTGDGWSITGTKVAVESGGACDHALVTADTPGGVSQILVPLALPGVTVSPMQSIDLTRRYSVIDLDAVAVGPEAIVGTVGGASAQVAWQQRVANAIQCAEMVGAMDKAMDITVEWAFDRYSFGRPLASYQALKHRFADMKAWLEASHALADAAARSVQKDAADADEIVSGAKAFIGHYGPELCQECVQMHGGIGVTFEHDMHLYLRRVSLDAALHGTVREHRLRITDLLESSQAGSGAA